jgi:release factor glutamine methyltransferase
MLTIAQILKQQSLSESLLDVEVLLAHVLQVSRAYLRAFPERVLTSVEQNQFISLLEQRQQGVPVAYLIGRREFWSLDLQVTPDTLIPRPETELLVELALTKQSESTGLLADLGTGSGAIALALAHEKPGWQIYATDISAAALMVAKRNASRLGIKNVVLQQGSWCAALPQNLFDLIVSNPPYIGEEDADLEATVLEHEPRSALIAAEDGLSDLRQIIQTSRTYLKPKGWLLVEHGFRQGEKVRSVFLKTGYTQVATHCDLAGLERVTVGQWR